MKIYNLYTTNDSSTIKGFMIFSRFKFQITYNESRYTENYARIKEVNEKLLENYHFLQKPNDEPL